MWIVERMRYPTDRPTNRPTDTVSYRGALSHLKRIKRDIFSNDGMSDKKAIKLASILLYREMDALFTHITGKQETSKENSLAILIQ